MSSKKKNGCSARFLDKLMVASKHGSRCNFVRKLFRNVNDQSVSRERSLLLPLSLCVFSGHSKRQDILFNQPLVLPEIALLLVFDDTNSKCSWKAEFLIILSNPRTLSEQLRFCLHIQQDAAKEAICPQINYCILHCFCRAKWRRHPRPQPCPFWNHLPIV